MISTTICLNIMINFIRYVVSLMVAYQISNTCYSSLTSINDGKVITSLVKNLNLKNKDH